ncbi:MAG TPA: 50S ribosomal protein L11 [Candidatus Nanoarchaeia archaeon]|nr:50S ribosomal protein L11 [Candidatus Nanoarchaeia archaeon]
MNIKLLVDGGEMKPGPAIAQKLGPTGVPINKVIEEVNKATQEFKGMQVPVEIEVDLGNKTFEVEVFSPPISGLIKKEAGIEKGSGLQAKQNVANLSIEQIIKIAKSKMNNLLCNDLKSAVKTTIGSCTSLGILVENKPASEVGDQVDSGMYDKEIENEVAETPEEKRKELDSYFDQLKAEQDKQLKLENKGEEEASEKK